MHHCEKTTKKGKIIEELSNDKWLTNAGKMDINNKGQQLIEMLLTKLKVGYKRHTCNVKESTGQNPWWSPELDIERKRVRPLRRRYQNCNNTFRESYKEIYSENLKMYKMQVKKAKTGSWNNFCTEATKNNIFGLLYKIALNKIKRPVILLPKLKPNGTKPRWTRQ